MPEHCTLPSLTCRSLREVHLMLNCLRFKRLHGELSAEQYAGAVAEVWYRFGR